MVKENIKIAIDKIIVLLTFDGVFKRSNIYSSNAFNKAKKGFRNKIVEKLSLVLKGILSVSENEYVDKKHYDTIIFF